MPNPVIHLDGGQYLYIDVAVSTRNNQMACLFQFREEELGMV